MEGREERRENRGAAHQAPPPGDLPDPGIEPRSPTLEADALTFEPPGKIVLYIAL